MHDESNVLFDKKYVLLGTDGIKFVCFCPLQLNIKSIKDGFPMSKPITECVECSHYLVSGTATAFAKELDINDYFYCTYKIDSLKDDYPVLILSVISFVILGIICFFGVTKNVTVAAFSLNEYEVGQIADRTIIADRTLTATPDYPIVVREGEKIIRKGFAITEENYKKLEKMANTKEYIDYRAYADTLLYLFVLMILWSLLFSKVLTGHKLSFKELAVQIVFFIAIYSCAMFASRFAFFARSSYHLCIALPTALFIFLIALLFGERSSIFFSIIVALGVLNASNYDVVVFLFTLATCFCATRIVRKIETRIDMVFASVSIALFNIVFIFLLKVLFNDNFAYIGYLSLALAINGFICGILALGFITPLEQVLNTASVFRLIDLSDLNNLIKECTHKII